MKKSLDSAFTLKSLKASGFKRIGLWKHDKETERLTLKGRLPEEMAIYLFVIRGIVKYVGKSENVCARMKQYARGVPNGSRKVDEGIVESIAEGLNIGVYMYPIDIQDQFVLQKGLPVDLVCGIERALIKELNPEWNGYRKKAVSELRPVR